MPSALTEYSPEWETFQEGQFEWPGESGPQVFSEIDEMDLAAELLAVRDEQELDQFLGRLIRNVGRRIGATVRSPVGQAIARALKDVVKNVLPLAVGAAGTFVGGPLGTALGSGLAPMAGQALGLELEGLSHEDQEFAAARCFVRFASEAVKNTASTSSTDDPAAAAHVVADAAQRLAPVLLRLPVPRRRDDLELPTSMTRIGPAEETMHDIDRTQLEFEPEAESFEYEQYEEGEWPGETEASSAKPRRWNWLPSSWRLRTSRSSTSFSAC
jgi:hypothetical protein